MLILILMCGGVVIGAIVGYMLGLEILDGWYRRKASERERARGPITASQANNTRRNG